jgi:DNA-binding SARP family transcriptional activator
MNVASRLRIYVCGRLGIEHPGGLVREAELPGRQGRRLWAYLVLNRRRPIARDELANAIWGDDIPDAWAASLNALVSRLRATLRRIRVGEPRLAIQGEVGRYVLEAPDDAYVDLERGWRALLRAEAALRAADHATAAVETLIARTIAGRGFLAGEEGGWIEAHRRGLIDTLIQATELGADVELRSGRPQEAQRIARELLTLDPLRESGYRLLMRVLAAEGNGAQAVRVMDECRRVLQREGGLEPSPETERVFREVAGVRVGG